MFLPSFSSRWETDGKETDYASFFFLLMPEENSPFPKKKAEADQSSNVLPMGRSQRESQTTGKEGREVSQFKRIPLSAKITNPSLERFSGGPFSYSVWIHNFGSSLAAVWFMC